ncbi:flagellum-specific ATP synthase FliI [Escherichia coli]|nr:flagellum-specific ATP synthase FliI [Escherichia coli]EFD4579871.1 flagellum-specific ATP synthase FliI [Escherichia coli]
MSDNLPWKTWTPDDLAPPQAEFVPMVESEETIIEEAEPSLEQQLAQLQMQAHEQGYQAGIAEGRQQGHKQGYQEGLAQGLEQGLAEAKSQQAPIHARMQQLVSEFQTTLDALDSVIASRLMQMALEAARQVIGQTPTVDNSALIKQIQQLLQQEPLFSGKPQLRVHPDDLQRVDDMLGATLSLHGWRLRGDPTLHPGGCKVSADEGDLDASVATRWLTTLDNFEAKMAQLPAVRRYGRLTRATGLVLEATGLQLPLGATCVIERQNGSETHEVESEVVGFNGQRLFLMPLEEVEGVLPGARVYAKNISAEGLQSGKQLPLGPALLGRVLDGSGKPLDGLPSPDTTETGALITPPFNPLQRTPIEHVLDTGVRPINALLTVGRGQRMGLFAGSGVGKSVLLGMMARYTRADVIVVGLIGERGREVKDFIENILGAEGRARSVVIAAPADVSPLLRMQGAAYATRIAEDFRDRGQHVLLIMDSLTRYAMAQREIALAIGEPPATKGYPPSVFAKLPALVERAGNGISGGGSITAFYTVLTEGDDQQDPIADSARAILDGHIVLSRRLAEAGHYPAIDIEASISRAMTALISEQHYARVRTFKQLLSSFQRNRDLVSVGAYAKGSDPMLDKAIALWPQLEGYLQQGIFERADWEASLQGLERIFPTVS